MAIFTKKEEKTEAPKAAKRSAPKKEAKSKKKAGKPSENAGANLTKTPGRILKSPRVTEKAAYMTVSHTYVFEVAQDATKRDVVTAVQSLYGVVPRKVNMVVKQPRAYVAKFRNRRGTKKGLKKAYVFLKEGDKIDLA